MSTVAVIPARGGSTRIPRKNIREFHGKPIIAYSIEAARESGLFDRVIVSTDDDEIMEVAQSYGADIIVRPQHLADNGIGTQEVMRHAANLVDASMLCCIYPTSPMLDMGALHYGMTTINAGSLYAFSVGDTPALHDAGQFYWGRSWAFINGIPLISPHTAMIPIDPRRDCDINTIDDFVRAWKMYSDLAASTHNASGEPGLTEPGKD